LAAACAAAPERDAGDVLLVTGGSICVNAAEDRWVEALAVREGRVVDLGSAAELRERYGRSEAGGRVLDLGGGYAVPGLADAHGHLANLGAFFDRISRMSRLVNIGDVKINAQGTQTISNTIAVSAIATTYVYQEPPPTPPAGAPGAQR